MEVDFLIVDFMKSCSYKNWSRGSWYHKRWSRVSKAIPSKFLFLGFGGSVFGWLEKKNKEFLINIPHIMIVIGQEYSLEEHSWSATDSAQ